MADYTKKTRASIYLEQHPNIRNEVMESKEFVSWKSQFPAIPIDGIINYLIGGPVDLSAKSLTDVNQEAKIMNPGADQLLEEDDLILLWAQNNKLVTKEDIDKTLPN